MVAVARKLMGTGARPTTAAGVVAIVGSPREWMTVLKGEDGMGYGRGREAV
jgi:hypothetical protein